MKQIANTLDPAMLDADRFWAKTQRSDGADACWLWTGSTDNGGYGRVTIGGVKHRAHRVAVILGGGTLAPTQVVDHLCRVRNCVRPDHLEATTAQVNSARGTSPVAPAAAARMIGQCLHGHRLAEVGTYASGYCAACGREAALRYKARQSQRAVLDLAVNP